MDLKEISCKCPKCEEVFLLGEVLKEQALEKVQAQILASKDKDFNRRLKEEKEKSLKEGKSIGSEITLKKLEDAQEKLDVSSKLIEEFKLKEIEKNSRIKSLESNQELTLKLKLQEQKSESDAEKEKLKNNHKLELDRLKKDLESAKIRAEQGSMQVQGEVQELTIEDMLTRMFPSDEVIEVKKGQRGADCILVVRNNSGRPVGKIIFESKDTKSFSSDWIKKLKSDAINEGAQISVLVTTAWPSDNQKAHLREGVWVCGFNEYTILVQALRKSLMDVAKATASEEAREGKAQVMFDFLTSQEFANIIEQMISPIFRMNEQLQKEKRSITRLWKERETLIEGSIAGTENLYMKIQGIAQVNLPSVKGLDAIEDLSNDESIDEN